MRDEFEIPGSDTQKATDLIESEFASEQGGVLNLVFAAPEGEQLDTPERRAAIEEAIARLESPEFAPTDEQAGLESVGDPFSEDTVSDDGRIAYAEAQFDQTIEDRDRDAVVAVQDAVRETVEPAGVTVEFNGDAEFPPVEQGTSEALGLLAAIIVLLLVFRTFVAMIIPIALALAAVGTAFLLLFILAGLDGHQHDHADPRLDDRPRRRHRLLAVHRHALQTAPARRALAAGRRRRGRRVRGARRDLRRPHRRDLGERPGLHRPRLRHQARHRQRPRRADHGADRELAAAGGAGAARPQDRPAEGAVPAPGGRLRGGPREDPHRPLGPVRDRARPDRVPGRAAADPGPGVDVDARAPRRGRPGHAAHRADQPQGLRPARRGLRAGLQRSDPDRRGRERRPAGAAADLRRGAGLEGVASVGDPQLNDEETVAIVFVTPDSAPQDEETDKLVDRLRDDVVPAATAGGDAVAYVSGQTAAFKDIADQIIERMPLFLLYIIGVTFILLAMAFRSIVSRRPRRSRRSSPPSLAFGVLTLVVQEGHLLGSDRARSRPVRSRRSSRRSPSRSCSGSRWTTWSS